MGAVAPARRELGVRVDAVGGRGLRTERRALERPRLVRRGGGEQRAELLHEGAGRRRFPRGDEVGDGHLARDEVGRAAARDTLGARGGVALARQRVAGGDGRGAATGASMRARAGRALARRPLPWRGVEASSPMPPLSLRHLACARDPRTRGQATGILASEAIGLSWPGVECLRRGSQERSTQSSAPAAIPAWRPTVRHRSPISAKIGLDHAQAPSHWRTRTQ
ncbi:MAG: hypothetical protein FJX21_04510 [Alphaproteobacteria bacterium]|nr:hypothetical protein [Alphaproteobacteria bacterium]